MSVKVELISGSLSTKDERLVNYWPVEMSRFSLSLLTDVSPEQLHTVLLKSQNGAIELVQQNAREDDVQRELHLIRFKARNHVANVEEAVRNVAELKNVNSAGPVRVFSRDRFIRAARFPLQNDLSVKAKTFGTSANYPLAAENVSKSGILLTGLGEVPPFKEGTILELTIDPVARHFKAPVACLAKVVRYESQQGENGAAGDLVATKSKSKFALQLIDLEPLIADIWGEFVDRMEQEQLCRKNFAAA